MSQVSEALAWATIWHAGQVRKYTGEPYVQHCIRVANKVAKHQADAVVAASLLHDVIEDCEVSIDDLRKKFSHEVVDLVVQLTNVSKPEDGNRGKRAEIERRRILHMPYLAKVIKLADMIDNCQGVIAHDPGFAKVYVLEKEHVLMLCMKDLVEHPLYTELYKIINGYFCRTGLHGV